MNSLKSPAEIKTQQEEKEEMKNEKSSDLQKLEQAVGSKSTAIPDIKSKMDIFSMMNAKSRQLKELRKEITDLNIEVGDTEKHRDELKKSVRPVRRLEKKYNPNGIKFEKIPSHDRKGIKLEIRFLENQLILLKDKLADRNAELSRISGILREDIGLDKVRNKAQSKDWTKRNKRFVKARLLKTLNLAITTHKEDLLSLSILATSTSENAKEEFSKALQNFLDEVDAETSILCSHQLRGVLYEALRLTLKEWDSETSPAFTELIIPEKQ